MLRHTPPTPCSPLCMCPRSICPCTSNTWGGSSPIKSYSNPAHSRTVRGTRTNTKQFCRSTHSWYLEPILIIAGSINVCFENYFLDILICFLKHPSLLLVCFRHHKLDECLCDSVHALSVCLFLLTAHTHTHEFSSYRPTTMSPNTLLRLRSREAAHSISISLRDQKCSHAIPPLHGVVVVVVYVDAKPYITIASHPAAEEAGECERDPKESWAKSQSSSSFGSDERHGGGGDVSGS